MTDRVEIHHPQWSSHNVTLVCGPPGSGKSTLAASLHANVIELEQFDHLGDYRQSLKLFGRAAWRIGRNPSANAAVVRGAPTAAEREHHEQLCRPARTVVLLTPADVCLERINAREHVRPGSIEGVGDWWRAWLAEQVPAEPVSQRWE